MPNLPPTLSDWKSVIPNPNGNFCDQFRALLRLPVLTYQFMSWAFEIDGKTPTSDFLTAIGGAGNTTVVNTQSLPGVVANVTATTGFASVTISWNPVATADSYYVYRMTTNTPPTDVTAYLEPPATSTAFSDVTATPGTDYYYYVRAHNAIGKGPASDYAIGSRIAGTSLIQEFVDELISASKTFNVPALATKMTVECWGGGGGGGYGTMVSNGQVTGLGPDPITGLITTSLDRLTWGGGGGGGGYGIMTDYAVVAGQPIIVVIGTAGGKHAKGGDTKVTYVTTAVVIGEGGYPGGPVTGGGGGSGSGVSGMIPTSGETGTDGGMGRFAAIGHGGAAPAGAPTGLGKGGNGGAYAPLDTPSTGTKGYCKISFSIN